MIVKVTETEINESRRLIVDEHNNRRHVCPVALAIKTATGIKDVAVTYPNFYIKIDNKWRRRTLPALVVRWISRYDFGLSVAPIEFELHDIQTQLP